MTIRMLDYDPAFYQISSRHNQPVAVALVAYNRPEYLQEVLHSLERNPESQTLPFYFFLDGGPDAKQEENRMLIEGSSIVNKQVIMRTRNYGCAKNLIDARRFMFDWCQYERIIVVEDDILLSPHYIRATLGLHEWAQNHYGNVGVSQCWSYCFLSEEEKREKLHLVQSSDHYWWSFVSYCMDRVVWKQICPLLYEFEARFINKIPWEDEFFKERSKPGLSSMGASIRAWVKQLLEAGTPRQIQGSPLLKMNVDVRSLIAANNYDVTSQDLMTGLALWLAGYVKIETVVNRARHIGEHGVTVDEELFQLLAHDRISLEDFEEDALLTEFQVVDRTPVSQEEKQIIHKFPIVSPTPVAKLYTPDSILKQSQYPVPRIPIANRPISNRERYATCTDVEWFHQNRYLATLNLATETLHTYEFHPENSSFTLLQTLNNDDGMQLHWPDMLAVSPDGSYLGITNTKPNHFRVNLYRMDPHTHMVLHEPIHVIDHSDGAFHGVRFSSDSRFMICTTTGDVGLLLVYRLEETDGTLSVTLIQEVGNPYAPFKPKSVDISGDGQFIIVCYGPTGGNFVGTSYGALAVFAWDPVSGMIRPNPISELTNQPELTCPDCVSFSRDDDLSFVVVQSQSADTVTFYPFDKENLQIGPPFQTLKNPEAQIHFPHGFSLSTDDQYLALSNYGDDTVTIYRLKKEEGM